MDLRKLQSCKVAKLQKKAPNALERLDAELKTAPVPSGSNGESIQLAEAPDVVGRRLSSSCGAIRSGMRLGEPRLPLV
jgi:hypothetical protein